MLGSESEAVLDSLHKTIKEWQADETKTLIYMNAADPESDVLKGVIRAYMNISNHIKSMKKKMTMEFMEGDDND